MILENPYTAPYIEIIAVASEDNSKVELIEKNDCLGGAMWSCKSYAKSPLVENVRIIGNTVRYIIKSGNSELLLKGSEFPAGICGAEITESEIAVSYMGLGGGGVGATDCRGAAKGVLRADKTPSGGGKTGRSTLWFSKMERVVIGIDDTDTPEEGATWSLAHRIGKAVETDKSRYLSHTITQLFPVKQRTKNCVATALEFATSEPDVLVKKVKALVEQYTLSDKTGMAVFRGFDTAPLLEYGWKVKRGEVNADEIESIKSLIDIEINGSGIIGAAASIPFSTKYDEALLLCGKP
ncbi:MAG: DUF1743 domain-containing protein [Methanocorpusculum sp.]|nr:DUF1743 domain-containing protein [Methanocorpusculum sp.]